MARQMRIAVGITCLAFFPVAAYGQASIAGTVTDSTGGILPGVTVEAASPALIEKVRSVTTDDQVYWARAVVGADGSGSHVRRALVPGGGGTVARAFAREGAVGAADLGQDEGTDRAGHVDVLDDDVAGLHER